MSLIEDAKRPEPTRAPLQENPRRKYGVASGVRMVPCRVNPRNHSFHPENEPCADCEELSGEELQPMYDWPPSEWDPLDFLWP